MGCSNCGTCPHERITIEVALGSANAETLIEVDALRAQQFRVGQLVGLRADQYRLFPAPKTGIPT